MMQWEKNRHIAYCVVFGLCGISFLITGIIQGLKALDVVTTIAFVSIALIEGFSLRSRKKPKAKKDSGDIQEGTVKKGGVNKKPTTPRPEGDPKGQGGAVAKLEAKKAQDELNKISQESLPGFTPDAGKSIYEEGPEEGGKSNS